MSYFISIVLCGRNDNYGRDYLKRLQTLVGGIDYFCAQQALSCQLVFVEWNPPIDRPPIKSVIKWGTHVGVKIITVPGQVDSRLPVKRGNSGLHEFIAKNAGVRRSDGQFVLACTSDLVFSPDLFQFLGRRQLDIDAVYRATRIDVRTLPEAASPAEAPRLCRRAVLSADSVGGRCITSPEAIDAFFDLNILSYLEFDQRLRCTFEFPCRHEPLRLEAPALWQFPHLIHVNAAGDFTLLSRQGWLELGGYLECDCRNHVDAWFCYHAVRRGFAQVLLPLRMCIFHQAHDRSPLLPFEETIAGLSQQRQHPNWGLADDCLPEEIIQTGTPDG